MTLAAGDQQALPGSTLTLEGESASEAPAPKETRINPSPTQQHSNGSADAEQSTMEKNMKKYAVDTAARYLCEGAGSVLFQVWCELDVDNNGILTHTEFSAVSHKLGVKWDNEKVWAEIVHESDLAEVQYVREARKASGQHITFAGFVSVYNRLMGQERRKVRLDIKTAFEKLQEVPEGLHKDGIHKLYKRCRGSLRLLPPHFEIEKDWIHMQALSDDDDEQDTIVFMVFERWWKLRMGISEADTPVIPEFFQYKLEELSAADKQKEANIAAIADGKAGNRLTASATMPNLNSSLKGPIRHYQEDEDDIEDEEAAGRSSPRPVPRSGKKLWRMLKGRLNMLVTMRRDWGNVDDFYGNMESQFGQSPLPWNIRDPESKFSTTWDLLQVVFLCFVSYTVPYRAGFGVEVEMFTGVWYWDTTIDLYFIVDLILNFFTAFYDSNGIREGRHAVIAVAYLRGWFIIDFVSCIPVQYIMLLFKGDSSNGSNHRVVKSLRLLRLSKMLRLARIKRILAKYENLEFVQQYSGMIALMFIIAFAGHLLACFWYLLGITAGTERQGDQVPGWALLEYCPKCADPTADGFMPCESLALQGSEEDCPSSCDWVPGTDTDAGRCVTSDGCREGCELDPSVAMSTRYVTSMYYVFNALDGNGRTDQERAFAVFGYIIMVIIDGAVAGVLSSVMISMGGKEREVNEKLAAAKVWMQEQRIAKAEQVKALNYFRHVYRSHVMYKEAEILSTMPPSMRLDFSMRLYATHLAQIPLFRGLGNSVIHALCAIVEPMLAVRSQVIYTEFSTGKEMYILISGELEITCRGQRLGFLSDGAFFGETPLLENSSEAEQRRRTVAAMTDCKLCFITRDAIAPIARKYPELAIKLKRCGRFNKRQAVNRKGKRFKMALAEASSAPSSSSASGNLGNLAAESWKAALEGGGDTPSARSPDGDTSGGGGGLQLIPLQAGGKRAALAPVKIPAASPFATRPADASGPADEAAAEAAGAAAAVATQEQLAAQAEQVSGLVRRMDELQEMMLQMNTVSQQTSKSVEAILQQMQQQQQQSSGSAAAAADAIPAAADSGDG